MDVDFKPAAPARNPETAPFWDAARDGRLLIKRCNACGEAFFYPRALCPFCLSATSWLEASGEGTIYSYTAVPTRDGAYIVALVTLAEGPTMMTNILAPDPQAVAIGQAVRVRFIPTTGDDALPVFVPA
ncbi:Zn-ribbon domain-containing OB-fold protein [Niveispirillum sp.]|uniref:Zn-ribbon domain-containing OB-fold protein n=1 Tax=Niveispirillum sp. TaxID=1917217 RepID=UPI001B71D49A|nr:Zn-ribbon domain-containing OB-fold protein [Niveispirillum sp.]MBP7336541.1 Zn-ribbon domain-containing OB-fold protein [Niveispirillum sp.]